MHKRETPRSSGRREWCFSSTLEFSSGALCLRKKTIAVSTAPSMTSRNARRWVPGPRGDTSSLAAAKLSSTLQDAARTYVSKQHTKHVLAYCTLQNLMYTLCPQPLLKYPVIRLYLGALSLTALFMVAEGKVCPGRRVSTALLPRAPCLTHPLLTLDIGASADLRWPLPTPETVF